VGSLTVQLHMVLRVSFKVGMGYLIAHPTARPTVSSAKALKATYLSHIT